MIECLCAVRCARVRVPLPAVRGAESCGDRILGDHRGVAQARSEVVLADLRREHQHLDAGAPQLDRRARPGTCARLAQPGQLAEPLRHREHLRLLGAEDETPVPVLSQVAPGDVLHRSSWPAVDADRPGAEARVVRLHRRDHGTCGRSRLYRPIALREADPRAALPGRASVPSRTRRTPASAMRRATGGCQRVQTRRSTPEEPWDSAFRIGSEETGTERICSKLCPVRPPQRIRTLGHPRALSAFALAGTGRQRQTYGLTSADPPRRTAGLSRRRCAPTAS